MLRFLLLTCLIFFSIKGHGEVYLLRPICFETLKSCDITRKIIELPGMGNFIVNSKCKMKNPRDNFCSGLNFFLEINALLNLPQLTQWQLRNQCYQGLTYCQQAHQMWSQLYHDHFSFTLIECKLFNRLDWAMNDLQMDNLGIFRCPGDFQIRIKATRTKIGP